MRCPALEGFFIIEKKKKIILYYLIRRIIFHLSTTTKGSLPVIGGHEGKAIGKS
jgi:hypothetical protein